MEPPQPGYLTGYNFKTAAGQTDHGYATGEISLSGEDDQEDELKG